MASTIYLDEDDVRVTKTELVISGTSTATKDVLGVSMRKEAPFGCLPNMFIGIGALVVLAGLVQGLLTIAVGGLIIAGAIIWYKRLPSTYYLLLDTVKGKVRILDTKDKDKNRRVHDALKKALE